MRIVIRYIFWIGQNWKYLLKFSHIYKKKCPWYCRKMWQSSNIELNNDHVLFLTFLSRKKTSINLTNFFEAEILTLWYFFHLMPITLGSTFGFKNHRFLSPSRSGYTVLKKDCNLRPKGRQSRFSPRHSSDSTEEYTNYLCFWPETDQKIRENATFTHILEEYEELSQHGKTKMTVLQKRRDDMLCMHKR